MRRVHRGIDSGRDAEMSAVSRAGVRRGAARCRFAGPDVSRHVVVPVGLHSGGGAGDPGASNRMTDEDILRVWHEQSSALRELWPAETDMQSWECLGFRDTGGDSARQVVEMMLGEELGDAATIPAALGELDALVELHLDFNLLTSVPETLGNLSSLSVLSLTGNQLTNVPEVLGNLSSLSVLYLNVNQLTSVPDALGNISSQFRKRRRCH